MNIHEVVMKLLLEQPYYGYIASQVAFHESDTIATIRMASLPDLVIAYNPVWFDELSVKHKMGVVIHELLHVLLLHQYRREMREIILWSVACDMAVNEILPEQYQANDAVTVDRITKKLKRKIDKYKTAEYYYELITDVEDLQGFASIEGDSILIFEGEGNLRVEKLSDQNATSMEISALKNNLAQTIADAKADGEMPTIVENQLEEVYKDLTLDWRVIFKRFLTGRGKILIRKSYKRQSRRYEDLPGTKRSIGVNALIAIDESGSISDALVKAFYQELQEINKITGASMAVTRFDTACSEPVPLNTFVAVSKREKRGGTDFRPIFTLADEMKIPLVIIFTDGDGEAPPAANQKTLWVLTKKAKKPAAFGYFLTFEGGSIQ